MSSPVPEIERFEPSAPHSMLSIAEGRYVFFDHHQQVVAAKDKRIEELKAALRPFAALAEEVDRLRHPDHSTCQHRLLAEDVRVARDALGKRYVIRRASAEPENPGDVYVTGPHCGPQIYSSTRLAVEASRFTAEEVDELLALGFCRGNAPHKVPAEDAVDLEAPSA